MMKVDEEATKEARRRHREGVNKMSAFFGLNEASARLGVPQDQRWLTKSKAIRLIYRRYRQKKDPQWPVRRRARKRQRQARKAQR
jgi:hypothetical protein